MNVTCEYCGRDQPAEHLRCIGCGAPLPIPRSEPLRVSVVDSPSGTIPSPAASSVGDTLQEGLKTVGALAGTLGIGSIVLRVTAQGIAIAVSSFIVGLTAGNSASGQTGYLLHLLTALFGGVLLGVVVTLVKKRTIWTLLAAPTGTILGSVAARLLPEANPTMPINTLLALAGGLLLAVLGGYRTRGARIPFLKVLQPVVGAIGGLLFALLGFFVMYRV
jgi:hypothetical protein